MCPRWLLAESRVARSVDDYFVPRQRFRSLGQCVVKLSVEPLRNRGQGSALGCHFRCKKGPEDWCGKRHFVKGPPLQAIGIAVRFLQYSFVRSLLISLLMCFYLGLGPVRCFVL